MVHDKILNFLTPRQNVTVFEGRDALVGNLFGVKRQVTESVQVGKKRKAKQAEIDSKADEDIKLI